MTYKRVTMRIETARVLRCMLRLDEPLTVDMLASEMGLMIENAHRRALAMLEQKFITREKRYAPVSASRTAGRAGVYFMWVTIYGKERLAEYAADRVKRPNRLKDPAVEATVVREVGKEVGKEVGREVVREVVKAPTRPKVGRHVPNSIFDLARSYAQKE